MSPSKWSQAESRNERKIRASSLIWECIDVQFKTYFFKSAFLKKGITYIFLVLLKYLRTVQMEKCGKRRWGSWACMGTGGRGTMTIVIIYLTSFGITYCFVGFKGKEYPLPLVKHLAIFKPLLYSWSIRSYSNSLYAPTLHDIIPKSVQIPVLHPISLGIFYRG